MVYVNLIGGQDELVFDGCSLVVGPDGTILHRSPQFEEDMFVAMCPAGEAAVVGSVTDHLEPVEEVYRALETGFGDYVRCFEQVVIGLSGGIDSALTAVIASDDARTRFGLGCRDASRFSSSHSIDDARQLADNLGLRFELLPIDEVFGAFLDALDLCCRNGVRHSEENLQARTRERC